MKFGTDFFVPLRIKYNHFGDPLTFQLTPTAAKNVILSGTLVANQIPIKLVAFLSGSAVLLVFCAA